MSAQKFFSTLLTLTAILTIPFAAPAAVIDGSRFEDSLTVDKFKLELTGVGLFRYWGFKAYVGALYIEAGYPVEEVLLNRAKRIELEYRRAIRGEDFGPATNRELSKNIDSKTIEALRTRIDYHNSLYEDVKPGDRYSLTYIPGKGTQLALNNQAKGVIEGADFASAIFSIWLGHSPMNKSFKAQLLGRK